MRDHYREYALRGAEIVAVGPDGAESFRRYWQREEIPYIGLPDPNHLVAKLYKQEVNLFKLGRMPLNCVVDSAGKIRYVHYGASMADIPDHQTLLGVIDKLNAASI